MGYVLFNITHINLIKKKIIERAIGPLYYLLICFEIFISSFSIRCLSLVRLIIALSVLSFNFSKIFCTIIRYYCIRIVSYIIIVNGSIPISILPTLTLLVTSLLILSNKESTITYSIIIRVYNRPYILMISQVNIPRPRFIVVSTISVGLLIPCILKIV